MTAATVNTTTTVTAGEGGLGAYIAFGVSMAATCQNGADITEATLNDMVQRGWFGAKTDPYSAGMEHLRAAKEEFKRGEEVLRASLGITEQYANNVGAGDRESVTNV